MSEKSLPLSRLARKATASPAMSREFTLVKMTVRSCKEPQGLLGGAVRILHMHHNRGEGRDAWEGSACTVRNARAGLPFLALS